MDPTLAEVPPGALPAEVADDVDIKASEGEYVIPADVVRFLGLDYIEKMVNRAKEGLAEKQAEGRIGGKTEAPQEGAPPGVPMMAEGGLVEKDNFTGIKQFRGPSGNILYIPFLAGAPISTVPEGAVDLATNKPYSTPVAATPTTAPTTTKRAETYTNEEREFKARKDLESSIAGDPHKWAPETFLQASKGMNSPVVKGIGKGIQAVMPLGGIAMKYRENYLKTAMPEALDKMIATGKDPQGNTITPETMKQLTEAREKIVTGYASQPTRVGPLKGLMNLLNPQAAKPTPIKSPSTERDWQGKATITMSDRGGRDDSSFNSDLKGKQGGSKSSTSSKGNKTATSTPRYAKGGLVARPKAKC